MDICLTIIAKVGHCVRLEEHDFANLYFDLDDVEQAVFNVQPRRDPDSNIRITSLPCFVVDAEAKDDLLNLSHAITAQIEARPKRHEFCLTHPEGVNPILVPNVMRLRVSWERNGRGSITVSCRRLEAIPPEISELGFDRPTEQFLVGPSMVLDARTVRPGGVLISGKTSAGKTTTMMALLMHCLQSVGGVCYHLGTTPEYDVHGRIGNHGFFIHVPVEEDISESAWHERSIAALKWNPSIIGFGEIGRTQSAQAFIQASDSGKMAIATIHAEDITEVITRLASLAADKDPTGIEGRQKLLARSVSLLIHQTLDETGPSLKIVDIAAWRAGHGGREEVSRAFTTDPMSITQRADKMRQSVEARLLRETSAPADMRKIS